MGFPVGRRHHGATPVAPHGPAQAAEGLIRSLDASKDFRRDGRLAGIFHPGRVSFREVAPRDSLHIIIDGGRVSAHVDEISPLRCGPGRATRFSVSSIVAHNLHGMISDLGRRFRGRHGQQRCNLGCEVVWVDDDQISRASADVQAGRRAVPRPCDDAPG